MDIIQYQTLPKEAKEIRTEVFVLEQGFMNEFDEIDSLSEHFVGFIDSKAAVCCRVYYSDEKQSYVVGRIAVKKEYRGQGLGAIILAAAENFIKQKKGNSSMLSGQVRVSAFYEKQGYHTDGDIYMDEDCPHVWMKKEL